MAVDTNSNDPEQLKCRVFAGRLPTDRMVHQDLDDIFSPYGKIKGNTITDCSIHSLTHVYPDAFYKKIWHSLYIFVWFIITLL